jgi:hypothetical protein
MLEIDRLSLQVRAAAAPERVERLARRLRDAAVRGIERGRYALAPPGAPAYLFVERLALHCMVSTDWDDDAIGAEVARALAAALERSVTLPQTFAFRDRAELLAAFYCALAEGRAWERWWLEGFDGLRALPASAALRTSVMNEGAHGVAALARLTDASLSRVLRTLTPVEASRLVEWLARRPDAGSASGRALWRASASLEGPAGLLRALLALEREAPGGACRKTLLALEAMQALRSAAARGDLDGLLAAAAPAREGLLAAAAKLGVEDTWIRLLDESDAALIASEMARLGECPAHSAQSEPPSAPAAAAERLFTPRGGVFVLLKALDWLGWPQAWAKAHPDERVRSLAWTVALRALQPRDRREGFADPALQLAFGIGRPLKLPARTGVRRLAAALLEEFALRIPGLAGASPAYLRRNVLALPATVERRGERCVARLGRAPLDILLVLAGAKSGRIALPGAAVLELFAQDSP